MKLTFSRYSKDSNVYKGETIIFADVIIFKQEDVGNPNRPQTTIEAISGKCQHLMEFEDRIQIRKHESSD